MLWIAIVVAACGAAVLGVLMSERYQRRSRARDDARRRYLVPESAERIAVAEPASPSPRRDPEQAGDRLVGAGLAASADTKRADQNDADWLMSIGSGDEDENRDAVVTGRMVETPEGEMILTTPPFELKASLLNRRERAYGAAISRQLNRVNEQMGAAGGCGGLVLCPKVRLESLLTPTAPDGRDPHDWRVWRRRVRTRAVDFVICDTRNGDWRPVVAIEIDRPQTRIKVIGGGIDRMIDEVLTAARLPLVRCSGHAAADWPMIEPYLMTQV